MVASINNWLQSPEMVRAIQRFVEQDSHLCREVEKRPRTLVRARIAGGSLLIEGYQQLTGSPSPPVTTSVLHPALWFCFFEGKAYPVNDPGREPGHVAKACSFRCIHPRFVDECDLGLDSDLTPA